MNAWYKQEGDSPSDLEAYRRAAAFCCDGAQVNFTMTIELELARMCPNWTQRGGRL